MITEVLITIDTEFSIAGAFTDLQKFPPIAKQVVEGRVGEQENGLGFLLDTFAKYQVDATFFVEAINVMHFGHETMGSIAQRIHAAGQDVQLHVHPVWAVFSGANYANDHPLYPRNDNLVGRSREQVESVLEIGMDAFKAWGLPPPQAVRTGSLMIDTALYPSFAKFDLSVSSSVGTGIYLPEDPDLQIDSGKRSVNGVTEIPLTSYYDLPGIKPGHRKTLQITSCSWIELKALLKRANQLGYQQINILTHPFEYFKRSDFRYSKITRNRVNQQRLTSLCDFVAQNPDRFKTSNFVNNISRWCAAEDYSEPRLASPSSLLTASRMLHNVVNDRVWAY